MVDIANTDEGQPQGEPVVDNSEFDATWAELDRKDEAGEQSPPYPEVEKLDGQRDEPQGPSADAPPVETPAAKPGADENQPDDPWKDAPEHLRNLHFQEVEKREQTIRSNAGRLSAATRDLQALRAQVESQRSGEGTDKGEEAKDKEERLAQLREEYPEVAAPILDQMARLEEQVGRLTAAEDSRIEATADDLVSEQEKLVVERHGDLFDQVRATQRDTFLAWMNDQPKGIQDMIARNGNAVVDASEVNLVLDLFQQGRGGGQRNELQERRERQLGAGRLPTTRGPGGSPSSKPTDDYDAAWDEFEAKDRARAAKR